MSAPFPMEQIAAESDTDTGVCVKIDALILGTCSVEKHQITGLLCVAGVNWQDKTGGDESACPVPSGLTECQHVTAGFPMDKIVGHLDADSVFGGMKKIVFPVSFDYTNVFSAVCVTAELPMHQVM